MRGVGQEGSSVRCAIVWLGVVAPIVGGCSQPPQAPWQRGTQAERLEAWPADWSLYLDKRVTVEGWPAQAKLGPILTADQSADGSWIWMDGKEVWSSECFIEPGKAKRVRVTGCVIKRDDLPVYIAVRGTWPPRAIEGGTFPFRDGIAVYSNEEFEQQKWRFLLTDATWTVLE
jgi:hypothetical protein